MTPQDQPDPRLESTVFTEGVVEGNPEPRSTESLPFLYEDRSDGRHDRVMAQFAAAMAWTKQQRELGRAPN